MSGDAITDARRQIAAHQRNFSDEHRARLGVFYTPPALARATARAALHVPITQALAGDDPARLEGLRLLDPAVGAGALLLEALLLLEDAHRALCARLGLDVDDAERRARLCAGLYGVDIHAESTRALKALFQGLGGDVHTATRDALLEPLPEGWPERFDAVLSNPPFGTVNRLGRGSPRAAALAERFPAIWQDKIDRAAFFVARGLELSDRVSVVLPAALMAADKAQRWRAWLARRDLRLFDAGDAVCFEDTRVRTALLDIDGAGGPRWRGWRIEEPDQLEAALEAFGGHAEPPDGVIRATRPAGARWHVVADARRARWAEMDAGAPRLGARYPVGKGMETGCNRAFELPETTLAALEEGARARWVRRRIRGVEVERLRLRPASRWLLFAPAEQRLEALPEALRAHLEGWRERLEGRAAYRRGDCAWWAWTWPLHAARYASMHRVITGYRGREHRFAVVPPGGGIGLTDTTAVFAPSADEAWALAGWLCSAPAAERYAGIGKETGGGMREFFENQLRELPLPRRWDANRAEIAAAARRFAASRDEDDAEALDTVVWDAYGRG